MPCAPPFAAKLVQSGCFPQYWTNQELSEENVRKKRLELARLVKVPAKNEFWQKRKLFSAEAKFQTMQTPISREPTWTLVDSELPSPPKVRCKPCQCMFFMPDCGVNVLSVVCTWCCQTHFVHTSSLPLLASRSS